MQGRRLVGYSVSTANQSENSAVILVVFTFNRWSNLLGARKPHMLE